MKRGVNTLFTQQLFGTEAEDIHPLVDSILFDENETEDSEAVAELLRTLHDPSWRRNFPPEFDSAVFTDPIDPRALQDDEPQYIDTETSESDDDHTFARNNPDLQALAGF